MQQALAEARTAAQLGEVPVGAVLVADNRLLAAAGNSPIALHDPTAHAEIRVLRRAAKKRANYRLPGTTLYVTLEPCIMCMGAIIHARVERVVFGAYDPKTGAACSVYQLGTDSLLNHALTVEGGLLQEECSQLLKSFFRAKRQHFK